MWMCIVRYAGVVVVVNAKHTTGASTAARVAAIQLGTQFSLGGTTHKRKHAHNRFPLDNLGMRMVWFTMLHDVAFYFAAIATQVRAKPQDRQRCTTKIYRPHIILLSTRPQKHRHNNGRTNKHTKTR